MKLYSPLESNLRSKECKPVFTISTSLIVIEVLSSEKDKAAQRQAASAKAATIREELNRRSHEKLLGSEDAALQAELAELEKVISG